MQAKARERGLDVFVDSAGVSAEHAGECPDARMLRAALRRGYDLSLLRARQIALADFYRFDMILAMDLTNQSAVLAMAPPDRICDIRLFLDFAEADPREAPDPWHGGPEAFETVLDLMEAGADAFLDYLEDERA